MRTFAWFQAQAQVNVSASSADPVEITVSAPDSDHVKFTVTIHAYDNNGLGGYDTNHVPTSSSQFTTAVTSASELGSVWPGRKKSFMITATSTATIPNVTLDLQNINTDNCTNSKRVRMTSSTSADDNNKINLGSAIKIYAAGNTTGTFSAPSNTATMLNNNANTRVWSVATVNNKTVYLFLTFEFIDDSSTRYQEYTKNESVYTATDIAQSDDQYRYFLVGSGNNNCFEGMSFVINKILLSVSE